MGKVEKLNVHFVFFETQNVGSFEELTKYTGNLVMSVSGSDWRCAKARLINDTLAPDSRRTL